MPCTLSTKHNIQELLQTKRDILKVRRHLWFNLWSGKHSSRNWPVQGPGSRTHLKHTQKPLLMNYRRITNTFMKKRLIQTVVNSSYRSSERKVFWKSQFLKYVQVHLRLEYHEKGQYFVSPISESETNILYRFITQSEICQAFISWNIYDYGLQIMKTQYSVSQKIWILHKINTIIIF